MPTEASTHLLAYGSKRLRAMNSRSYRVVSPSTNTSSATLGQTIEFRIPGNQMASFLDNSSMYFKFTVQNNDGSAINLEGKSGAYALIKKIDILTSGQTISSVDAFNVLHSCFVDTDTSTQYSSNVGKVLYGAGATKGHLGGVLPNVGFSATAGDNNVAESVDTEAVGQQIAAAGSASFVLPFVMNCLANSKKYIPLFSRDAITIKVQLESALLGTIGAATDAEVAINTPELIYNVVELDAAAFSAVSSSVDDKFEIVADDYRHTSATTTSGASQTVVANLGFAFSSLNRVIIAQRNNNNLTAGNICIGNRARRDLEEVQLLLNGESIPSRPIRITDQASESLAELLIADRALVATDHDSRLNRGAGFAAQDPDGSNTVNCGNFLVQIDTESMRSNNDDPGIYAGVSTIGSVLQAQLKYGSSAPAGNAGFVIDFFAQYTSLLTLDMKGSQTFVLSV